MAIDGSLIKEAEFFDTESMKNIKINLSVRDIIFFRLLERIAGNLKHG